MFLWHYDCSSDSRVGSCVGRGQKSIIFDETNRATTAENTIRDTLDAKIEKEITDRIVDVDAEETARKNADVQLGESIADLTLVVNNEIRDRITKCDSLQEQINNINSRRTSYASTIIGDGINPEFLVNHNLNSRDIILQVFDIESGYDAVLLENRRINNDQINLKFKDTPAEGKEYRVLCQLINSDISISYNANGGTGAMSATIAVKGLPVALSACGFEAPEGYMFKAWAIGSPEGTQVVPPEPYTFNADSTAYAIWEPISGNENVHYGKVKDDVIPTSIEGLNGTYITKDILLTEGFTLKAATNEERIVVAIKKNLGIALEAIKYKDESGTEWQLGFKSSETAEDIIYYDEDGSTSYDYEWVFTYKFKEV